jgi:photosystem II stability/assembly factor-like uncharacterized protein
MVCYAESKGQEVDTMSRTSDRWGRSGRPGRYASGGVGRQWQAAGRGILAVLSGLVLLTVAGVAQDRNVVTDEEVARKHGLPVEQVQQLHNYRRLTNDVLWQMSKERVARVLWKLDNPRPDQPLGAAQFRLLQQTGGTDQEVPENALGKAIEKVAELRAEVKKRQEAAAAAPVAPAGAPVAIAGVEAMRGGPMYMVAGMPVGPFAHELPAPAAAPPPGVIAPAAAPPAPTDAGILRLEQQALPRPLSGLEAAPADNAPAAGEISTAGWKWLGPGNIGGRTRSILIHPANPTIMWAGSVAGGIWKTDDSGTSWNPLADFMASLNVSCMVLHPTNPNMLYAGTGEGFHNLDAFRGAGIFRSDNGGTKWVQLPATAGSNFYFVNRLAFSPDGSVLLAGTRTGLYRSTNAGAANPAAVTFEPTASLNGVEILDVDIHPTDNQLCVAGSRNGRAFYSLDGGLTWAASAGIAAVASGTLGGRVEVTYARRGQTNATSNPIYASVDVSGGEVWRSLDNARTFQRRNTGYLYLSNQGWYDNIIWAGDPTNPSLVLVGGVDLYRSTNGGQTLAKISEWSLMPASAHADQHTIVAHPRYNGGTNRLVFFGNDGGIYRNGNIATAAATTGWLALNNNYGVTQFYGAAINPTSGRIVCGAQDNGTLRYAPPPGPNTGPQGYKATFGGDGGWCAADPSNPNFFYGEYVFLQIFRSINAGESANSIYAGIDDAGFRPPGVPADALFIAPFILDPFDPNTMLAGGRRLWRSPNVTEATPAWAPIKDRSGTSYISAVEARRKAAGNGPSDNIWVGHSNGDVYKSSNGSSASPSWTQVDNGATPLPNRYCTRIRIDPSDVNRLYVAFGGYTAGNLWRTTNGGANWANIGAKLPGVSVYDMAIHPRNPEFLYVATEVGVLASGDGGATWSPTNQGPANVAVYELIWNDELLIAATHGRGLFWIDLTLPGPAIAAVAPPPNAVNAAAAAPDGAQPAPRAAAPRNRRARAAEVQTDPTNPH